MPSERAAIVGIYEHPQREIPGAHPFEVQAHCIRQALADAGLRLPDVDGLCTLATDPPEGASIMPVLDLAEWLGITPRYMDNTDIGGAAFMLHLGHAALAVAAGRADVVVVSYASLPRSIPFSYGTGVTDGVAAGGGQYEIPYGPTLAAAFAMSAQRHMHEYGTTPEQLASIAVTCRRHAGPNPDARYRDPISVDDVLSSPMIAAPLHRLDCCVVTDGAGAVVLTGAARAEDAPKPPVWLLGYGEATDASHLGQRRSFASTPAVDSGRQAFAEAGVSHDDIDVAQLYDAFSITPILALEDLGFCEKGEGGLLAERGELTIGGKLPINTDGGGLSSNHPGRRGIFTVIESVRQLRGEGPGVQVPDAKIALAHAIGGAGPVSSTVMIMGRR